MPFAFSDSLGAPYRIVMGTVAPPSSPGNAMRYALCVMALWGGISSGRIWAVSLIFERSRRLSLVLGSLGLGVFWGRLGGIRVSGASWSRRWRPREGVRTRDSGGGGLGGGYHGRGNQISPILWPPRFVSMHSPASPPPSAAHMPRAMICSPLSWTPPSWATLKSGRPRATNRKLSHAVLGFSAFVTQSCHD